MSLGKSSINSHQNLTATNPNGACIYEFEDFRLDASHLMLYRSGATVSLKPKVVETLVALVERAGEVVGKDELMDRLWHDAFVEEGNLAQNIYLLRKTLGNGVDSRPMIETFWRRGYRFNGNVRRSGALDLLYATHSKTLVITEEELEGDAAGGMVSDAEAGISNRPGSRWIWLMATGIIAALLIATTLFIFSPGPSAVDSAAASRSAVRMTRLTPDLDVRWAAISPDGKYAVYDLLENDRHSLWTKDIATGATARIAPPIDSAYSDPSFSLDGSYLYYNTQRKGRPNSSMFRIPSQGGEAQVIADDTRGPVTFSPDGRQIAFVRGPVKRSVLTVANADGGDETVLSERHFPDWFETWGSNLSWSPDGKRIAVCGGKYVEGRPRHQLIEVLTADGSQQPIATRNWDYIDDVLWLPDQSGLAIRARETRGSPWQIWRVSYPDGVVTPITNDLNDYDQLSFSADGRSLVVTRATGNWTLWSHSLEDPARTKQLTLGSSASDGAFGVAFAGDSRIIYTSPRDGNLDLWMLHAESGEQTQLTRKIGDFNAAAQVTPDGRYIVFISSRSGSTQVWRMDMDGGNPVALTDVGFTYGPQIAPDGQWVYFNLIQDDSHMIAKVSIDGGDPVIVKHPESPMSIGPISPDGASMVIGFYDDKSNKPWKHAILSLASGEIMRTFDGIRLVGGWSKDAGSIVTLYDRDQSNLWLQPIDGSEPTRLTTFEGGTIRTFAVSNDFKQLAIARGNLSAEAVLITNF